jgi:hypothetical protein
MEAKSKIDICEPRRTEERHEMLEPTCTKESADIPLPQRWVDRSERELPSLTQCTIDNVNADPRCCTPAMETAEPQRA